MGVCIKGMDMPTTSGLWLVIHPDGTVEYKTDDEGWKTMKECAVPVPPHGRLIDADANLAVMRKVLDNPYTDNGKIDTAMLRVCISMFEEAPTIIPAEEVMP